jgi:hypothetical protein
MNCVKMKKGNAKDRKRNYVALGVGGEREGYQ